MTTNTLAPSHRTFAPSVCRALAPICVFVLLTLFAPSSARAQAGADYVIGPQDVLMITLFDQPELNGKYTVELDGSFTFPLIGRIQAGGMTIRAFEGELRQRLADGFFRNPQVTVSIDTYRSQRVFVTGEVRSPGTYPLTGDMRLIEALARAGSTTATASDEVVVVRGGEANSEPIENLAELTEAPGREIIRINLEQLQSSVSPELNIALRDGDTIYVARAELVYVFGQVRSPGSYPIKSGTTVLQALSLAGGVTPQGAMNRTRVLRTVNGEQREQRVELTDVVQPGDTLIVPERFF